MPLVIIGDLAYLLLQWIMKPYSDNGRLSRRQSVFNYRLSHARVVAENAYGRHKAWWRYLLKRNNTHVSGLPGIVVACAILHNICEIHGDKFNYERLTDAEEVPMLHTAAEEGDHITTHAEEIRDALAQYFYQLIQPLCKKNCTYIMHIELFPSACCLHTNTIT